MKTKQNIAITQALILVIGIVAMGYAVGREVGFVEGANTGTPVGSIVKRITTAPGVDSSLVIDIGGKHYTKLSGGYAVHDGSNWAGATNLNDATKKAIDKAISESGSSKASEFFGVAQGGYMDSLLTGAQWGITVYYGVNMLSGMLGFSEAETEAYSEAAGWGVATYKGLETLTGEGGRWANDLAKYWKGGDQSFGLTQGQFTVGAGLIVAYFIYKSVYEEEATRTVTFTCKPWDAPVGGKKCEECNTQGILPCSEYQCRSLGQACQLLNPGTEDEKCTWVNPRDVNPPIITTWEAALLEDHEYTPDRAVSPPDTGVKVIYPGSTDGCVKAFTPLAFGINTDEPAKCKLDTLRRDSFDEMAYDFGGSSLLTYNHTQTMSLPSVESLEAVNLTIENDGEFELYTRCQDANGNYNLATFVFKYCVEQGPDTTPPLIVTTSLINGMPVAYNTTSVEIDVYTNEPATCKWSHTDQSYTNMEETMTCSNSVLDMNTQQLYECSTTLTGLTDDEENNFYFRCEDKPTTSSDESNTNQESYEFTIIGTNSLVLLEATPNNETIRDAADVVEVILEAETSAGYNDGEANCFFSTTGKTGDYTLFGNTESHEHSQQQFLPEGNYTYYIKCIDLGGNEDLEIINFNIETDVDAPTVVRIFHEGSNLRIITNEEAECVYDNVDCNYDFEDGIKMTEVDNIDHYADWDSSQDFYIKCEDQYGKGPVSGECNIIVRPSEII